MVGGPGAPLAHRIDSAFHFGNAACCKVFEPAPARVVLQFSHRSLRGAVSRRPIRVDTTVEAREVKVGSGFIGSRRKRAADEALVCPGQGVCVLPDSKARGLDPRCARCGVGCGVGQRAERTRNVAAMPHDMLIPQLYCVVWHVTLDTSKLSGWLNADACCRVQTTGVHTARG